MRACVNAYLGWDKPDAYSWEQAAVNASNLSELLLTLGRVGEADFAAWTRRIDRIDRSWRD